MAGKRGCKAFARSSSGLTIPVVRAGTDYAAVRRCADERPAIRNQALAEHDADSALGFPTPLRPTPVVRAKTPVRS